MNTLQNVFEREIEKSLTFPMVGAKIIDKKLRKSGIRLTTKQLDMITSKLEKHQGDTLSFNLDLDGDQIDKPASEDLIIKLDNIDDELDEIVADLDMRIQEIIPNIVSETASLITKALKRKVKSHERWDRRFFSGFKTNFNRTWKKPLRLMKMFITIVRDAGDEFNENFRSKSNIAPDFVLEALTRLHARSCQIALEIFALLKSGYADGAHARWRSLHEIAVVSTFIKTHGNDVAERYLLHDTVESYKSAKLQQEYSERLNLDPISESEFTKINKSYSELLLRFGENYKYPYGWAASALDINKPSFVDIEKDVELDHLRPYYKLASHNVHANPKGVLFRLGLYPNSDVLLAGPSDMGLADPAHGTAISLSQITTTLLMSEPSIDNLVLITILINLQNDIGDEFLKVQKSLEDKYAF